MLIVEKKYCNGCKLCEKSCPNHAISVVSGKAFIDLNKCSECLRCVSICPTSAIKQIIEFNEKIIDTKKTESQNLSCLLIDLQKKLSKVKTGLDRLEKKRRLRVY
jgi:ferredoxin